MYRQKIISKKNSFLLASWRSSTKIAGSGPASGSDPLVRCMDSRIRIHTKIHGSATLLRSINSCHQKSNLSGDQTATVLIKCYLTTGRYPPAYGRPIDGRVVLGPEVGWGGGGGRAALGGGCRGGGSGGGGAGGLGGGLAQDIQQQQAGQQQRHSCLVVSYNQNKQMVTGY